MTNIPDTANKGGCLITLERPGKYIVVNIETREPKNIEWYSQHQGITHCVMPTFVIPYNPTSTKPNKGIISADSRGNVIEWDLITKTINIDGYRDIRRDWGDLQQNGIWAINTTKNGKYLFTTDKRGHMKQFEMSSKALIRDYGNTHATCIFSIETTFDSLYLFTSDNKGHLRKYSIEDSK